MELWVHKFKPQLDQIREERERERETLLRTQCEKVAFEEESGSRLRRNLEEWCWSENYSRASAELLEQAIAEEVHRNWEGRFVALALLLTNKYYKIQLIITCFLKSRNSSSKNTLK